ncbi:MAG: hypothetical protein EA424_01620 [Planctomycetaceae bacterium]|nr:MAG: hypothetical protein EA424_01620 [Planctomycetaceae bacterium]
MPAGATKLFLVRYWPMEDGTHVTDWTLADDPQGRVTQLSGLAYSGHQNPLNPYDVNGDGHVTPQDVLLLSNEINRGGGEGPLAPRTAEQPGSPFFLDVLGNGYLTPNDVLQVINHINRGENEEEPSGQAEGEPAGDGDPAINYGWLAMLDTATAPATASVPNLALAAGRQNDLRINWLTDAVDDLAYRTTHRQPDLPLATWQRLGADAWQSDDPELPDWETLLDDPDTALADLDAYFAALG